jgi:3-phenylpropionate/trans-cinnamate dioxygenase ferredoxin reductase component
MHVVILGNGITGVTVARHLRKASPDVKITIVSGESDHHWSRPALMYIYMGHMRYQDTRPYEDHFWADNRIGLRRGWVKRIDLDAHQLQFEDGTSMAWDKLVLATGSVPNRFGWPGQDLDRVQGMYSLQDLISLERATPLLRRVVIVGGGLIGIEMAEMLHSRHIPVTMLVREDLYWNNVLPTEESAMVGRAIARAGIDLRLKTELVEIHDDEKGGVAGVTTSTGERIDCDLVGLTAGVRPNTQMAAASGIPTKRGILVDEWLKTSIPDVYAAGDCAQIAHSDGEHYGEQVWYSGRAQGEVLAGNILGADVPYKRGIWFNSAKFLHVEYQTYGTVPSKPQDGISSLYWEHADGNRSVRLVHRAGTFVGANVMGLRLRHRVCEKWIAEEQPLSCVIEHFTEAGFDGEFDRRHAKTAQAALHGMAS